jgi:hypothetical protein
MKLAKVMKAAMHRVAGGSEYCWQCFGPNARWMEFADIEDQEFADAVYDCKTNRVYQINIHIPGSSDNRCVTWIDPEYEHAYVDESRRRNVNPHQAWDNVMYTTIPGSEENMILDLMNDAAHCIYSHFPSARYAEKSATLIEDQERIDDNVDVVILEEPAHAEPLEHDKKYIARFTVEYEVTVQGEDLLGAYDQSLFAIQSLYTDEAKVVRTNITKESIEQL